MCGVGVLFRLCLAARGPLLVSRLVFRSAGTSSNTFLCTKYVRLMKRGHKEREGDSDFGPKVLYNFLFESQELLKTLPSYGQYE